MLDLHRHSEYSLFDGYGKAGPLARLAVEKGYTSLGISDHGTTSGLVEHYFSCKENGIKPIMGVEAYFQPKFSKTNKKYHLCLFAKDLDGYQNINRIMTEASQDYFYYKPTVTFELLEKYSDGIICSSACVGGLIPDLVFQGKKDLAVKAIKKFQSIYGDDFYIEIQPYKLSDAGMQEKVNVRLIKLAEKHNAKCILTSDSHYGSKEELPTYLKMHEISKTSYDVKATYGERYMPDKTEMQKRFVQMHKQDFNDPKKLAKQMVANLMEIESKVDDEILEKLELKIPQLEGTGDGHSELKKQIILGLKKRGKYNKTYLDRCKQEFDILSYHGFEGYFLTVQDYVLWAKNQGIKVGPGRGSVCNCAVAYALGITDVDPVLFGLDFTRFLRKDKKKLPDIDLDFEPARRGEVIDYIVNKYKGQAAQICSYGLFRVDNLINDLIKVCGVEAPEEKIAVKAYIKKYVDHDTWQLDYEGIKDMKETKYYNERYDGIITHFNNLTGQIRFLGTHAAGVAIVADDIVNYTALRKTKDMFTSAYDLNNLEKINAIKFDILGLKTMSEIKQLEELTGDPFKEEYLEDEAIFELFSKGDTDGIFQFERNAAKEILKSICADTAEDVIAANALNRPGPLSLGMPQQYAENKMNVADIKHSPYFEYTRETHGTVVYQEQITAICRGLGEMSWDDSDKVLKFLKGTKMTERAIQEQKQQGDYLLNKFKEGALKNGISDAEAEDIFDKITVYSFNKGHATGYALISMQHMYYKVHYPLEFWYIKMKHAPNEADLAKYRINAVKQGTVLMLPHVNGTADFSIGEIDGEKVIREGLVSIKNVGLKAAQIIEEERRANGNYTCFEDFIGRLPKRTVNKRVVDALLENGALEFNRKTYIKRVTKYNSALYTRGVS